jgi:hypothetical protein
MANTFKKVIDRMMWVSVFPTPNTHAAGVQMCSDLRSDISRNPFAYQMVSNSVLNRFNIVTKAWQFAINPGTTPAHVAGSLCVFAPSFAVVGTLAGGNTTSSIVLSTALPTAVGTNMLGNRGGSGDFGFKIRIIGNAAGGSGRIQERFIVANTSGTTPTITLDNPLTFTPATGDRYEILSGRVMMLTGGAMAAGSFRSFEVATNTLSSLSQTTLPATVGTDSAALVLDEQYTPYNHNPGEGFIKGSYTYDTNLVSRNALSSTGMAAGALSGQAASGDAVVVANEYRNFQIRIVEDLTNTTAVGQRRIISSHTSGPSPVYTLGSNWAVTPSVGAKYVIEYPNLIVLRTTGNTTVYTYNYTDATVNNGTANILTNAWSTTYFSTAAPAANGAGNIFVQSFGIQPDPARNARHSFNYFFRGGNSIVVDLFDIAGAIGGSWASTITIDGFPTGHTTINTGSCGSYSPFGSEGRFAYLNIYGASLVNQIYRFDVKNRVLSPYVSTDVIQTAAAAVGNRMVSYCAIDGTDLYDCILLVTNASTLSQELIPLV